LSQRDLPLWARGVAAGLLLFSSWWLFNTEGIRSFVGDSVGAVSLGVIAASTLRGMHLPLALWPDGPWRKQFSVPAVLATATLVAALILIARASGWDDAVTQIDIGSAITVVVGAVGLGFAVGFVRQRRYLAWYGIAVGLAMLPTACGLLFGSRSLAGVAPVVPSLMALTAIGITSKLVTEEIAFRRLVIGIAPGAGLLAVLASAAAAMAWYALLSRSGIGGPAITLVGTLGALCAGCIYVLSKSLVVSALFNAVYTAAHLSVALTARSEATGGIATVTTPAWVAAAAVSVTLAVVVVKQNGFFGNLREAASTNVTRS